MNKDDRVPYRWQDHVVTAPRAAAAFVASILVVIVLAAAAFLAPPPPTVPHSDVAARSGPEHAASPVSGDKTPGTAPTPQLDAECPDTDTPTPACLH